MFEWSFRALFLGQYAKLQTKNNKDKRVNVQHFVGNMFTSFLFWYRFFEIS